MSFLEIIQWMYIFPLNIFYIFFNIYFYFLFELFLHACDSCSWCVIYRLITWHISFL